MQKIYCSKCGNPNLYTQAKPKFCSACGTPFYGVIVEKPQDKKLRENKVRVQEEMDTEDDDEEDDSEFSTGIPELKGGLDVDIEFDAPRRESLSKIAGTVPDQLLQGQQRFTEKVSAREMMKIFKQEAGTLRQK
jgi:uncharacterized Zn finger protein (UPF0148 family)